MTKLNYWIDILSLITFSPTAVTSIAFFFNINTGIQRYTLIMIHDWFGMAFIVLMLIHLVLHFNWLTAMTKSFFKK